MASANVVSITPDLLIPSLLANIFLSSPGGKILGALGVLEGTHLSMGGSHANTPSTHCYRHVCLSSHSNKGEKRSFGSSRSGNSVGTTKNRCGGRRKGGAQSMSRYREVASPLTRGLMRSAATGSSGVWVMVTKDLLCSIMAFALFLKQQFLPIRNVKCTA